MSILLDDAQRAISDQARRVLDGRVRKERLLELLDQPGQIDESFWRTAKEQGWTGIAIAEAHGGLGLGLLEMGLVAEAAGAVVAGAPFLTTNHAAGVALAAGGAGEWLSRLASGDAVLTAAFAEETAILPEGPRVRFDGQSVYGTKHGVTAGLHAHAAVVWAMRDDVPVLVLVDMRAVERDGVDSFDNSRGYAHLTFDAAPGQLLAEGAHAGRIALDVLANMAVVIAFEQLGGARSLLYLARDYANQRKAFGQPIGAFQSVKHRIAELYGLVEIARANCIHAAARAGQPDFLLAAAAARLSATEAYDTAARDCVQVHGGIGVTWEAGIHLHMRRARSLAMECGNALFWEDILVDELAS